MADTYKGESLQKKHARYATHVLVRDWIDARYKKAWRHGMHAFLASREGGDIGVLRSLDVPYENMIGFERDQHAFEECAKKWVDRFADAGATPALVHCTDAINEFGRSNACLYRARNPTYIPRAVNGMLMPCPMELETGTCWLQEWGKRSENPFFSSVFWDFCSHIEKHIVDGVLDTWTRLPIGGVLSIAVLKGREKTQAPQRMTFAPMANRAARRAEAKQFGHGGAFIGQMIRGERPWCMGEALRVITDGLIGERSPAMSRYLFWLYALSFAERRFKQVHPGCPMAYVEPIAVLEYQSRTTDSDGVPMLILSFGRRREVVPPHVIDNVYHHRFDDESSFAWRNKVLRENDAEKASLILNVPKTTATAWKAHVTRGTYGRTFDLPEDLFEAPAEEVA